MCQLPLPLVVQIYAPLENSSYHRTLYVFACINPNCWNHNERYICTKPHALILKLQHHFFLYSWVCLRIQTLEQVEDISSQSIASPKTTDWCADADDWGDGNANLAEENGNIISNLERISDEEEESCSLEESIRAGFGNLTCDDKNANTGAETQGEWQLKNKSNKHKIEHILTYILTKSVFCLEFLKGIGS